LRFQISGQTREKVEKRGFLLNTDLQMMSSPKTVLWMVQLKCE